VKAKIIKCEVVPKSSTCNQEDKNLLKLVKMVPLQEDLSWMQDVAVKPTRQIVKNCYDWEEKLTIENRKKKGA